MHRQDFKPLRANLELGSADLVRDISVTQRSKKDARGVMVNMVNTLDDRYARHLIMDNTGHLIMIMINDNDMIMINNNDISSDINIFDDHLIMHSTAGSYLGMRSWGEQLFKNNLYDLPILMGSNGNLWWFNGI